MISRERSFNRLCRLIRKAPDDDRTESELTELLNSVIGGGRMKCGRGQAVVVQPGEAAYLPRD